MLGIDEIHYSHLPSHILHQSTVGVESPNAKQSLKIIHMDHHGASPHSSHNKTPHQPISMTPTIYPAASSPFARYRTASARAANKTTPSTASPASHANQQGIHVQRSKNTGSQSCVGGGGAGWDDSRRTSKATCILRCCRRPRSLPNCNRNGRSHGTGEGAMRCLGLALRGPSGAHSFHGEKGEPTTARGSRIFRFGTRGCAGAACTTGDREDACSCFPCVRRIAVRQQLGVDE